MVSTISAACPIPEMTGWRTALSPTVTCASWQAWTSASTQFRADVSFARSQGRYETLLSDTAEYVDALMNMDT